MRLTYVDDFAEMAKHFYAIIPDGYFDNRPENPLISDVLITGLTAPQAAAITRFFHSTYVKWDRSIDQDAWDILIHSVPTQTAESFCHGLAEWLDERGLL
jgi:hypothetical protein